jgi:hypothetical protein
MIQIHSSHCRAISEDTVCTRWPAHRASCVASNGNIKPFICTNTSTWAGWWTTGVEVAVSL